MPTSYKNIVKDLKDVWPDKVSDTDDYEVMQTSDTTLGMTCKVCSKMIVEDIPLDMPHDLSLFLAIRNYHESRE